jgi:ketosteroid isomerase-like protein
MVSARDIEIRKIGADFDSYLEEKDLKSALSYFHKDTEIQLMGLALKGLNGAEKFLKWLFDNLDEIKFHPSIIIVEGDTFFEEFLIEAKTKSGSKVSSKQTEVLVFEGDKIISLRLYFDRLDFVKSIARKFPDRLLVNRIIVKSIEGLSLD